jgi:hypothetical protein
MLTISPVKYTGLSPGLKLCGIPKRCSFSFHIRHADHLDALLFKISLDHINTVQSTRTRSSILTHVRLQI